MYSPINTSIELSGDKYYIATIITGLYEINKLNASYKIQNLKREI